jgi:hypothetical protein
LVLSDRTDIYSPRIAVETNAAGVAPNFDSRCVFCSEA